MNNKHRALWAVGALIAVFLALVIWYMWTHPAPRALAPGDVATTTPSTFVDNPLHIVDNSQFYEIDVTYPSGVGFVYALDLTDEAASLFPPPGPVPPTRDEIGTARVSTAEKYIEIGSTSPAGVSPGGGSGGRGAPRERTGSGRRWRAPGRSA